MNLARCPYAKGVPRDGDRRARAQDELFKTLLLIKLISGNILFLSLAECARFAQLSSSRFNSTYFI
jgi:hypothetical protein